MKKIIIEEVTDEKLKELNIEAWSEWGCDISEFDWQYSCDEQAYILEGKVIVSTDEESVEINKGNLVIFPKGMHCRWNVMKPIRKVYRFL